MSQTGPPSHSSRVPRLTAVVSASASAELVDALKTKHIDTTRWPRLHISAPDSFDSLDEAIENLFGYDWIIFVSETGVTAFLDRFRELGHEISELDSLRVCALGELTLAALERQHVHLDVISQQFGAARVVQDIAVYVGGSEGLKRQTFLVPQAMIGREYLKPTLEDAGARADLVTAYETVTKDDALRLVSLKTILSTGGIDSVIFTGALEVEDFARVFDTLDLSHLLTSTEVVCGDEETSRRAAQFGLSAKMTAPQQSPQQIAEAIAAHLLP